MHLQFQHWGDENKRSLKLDDSQTDMLQVWLVALVQNLKWKMTVEDTQICSAYTCLYMSMHHSAHIHNHRSTQQHLSEKRKLEMIVVWNTFC